MELGFRVGKQGASVYARCSPEQEQSYADFGAKLFLDGHVRPFRAIDSAIQATVARTVGTRNEQLFALARRFKAIEFTKNKPAKWFQPIIYEWFKLSFSQIGTKRFGESFNDFCRGWNYVECPYGSCMAEVVAGTEGGTREKIMAVCQTLTRENNRFFLGSRAAGEWVGVSHNTAARHLRKMQTEGLIELVEPHRWTKKKGRSAPVYRWKK